jgi:molybdate transport system ATP-binding protein
VALSVGEPGRLSIRNRLPATVTEIRDGSDGAVDVRLDVGGEPLLARITHAAVRDLDLEAAMPVTALIKAAAFGRPDDPA